MTNNKLAYAFIITCWNAGKTIIDIISEGRKYGFVLSEPIIKNTINSRIIL